MTPSEDPTTTAPADDLDDRSTRLGRRGHAGDAVTESDGAAPADELDDRSTRLGRRGHTGDAVTESDGTQLGRRRDLEDAPTGTGTRGGSRAGDNSATSPTDEDRTGLGRRHRGSDTVTASGAVPTDADQVVRFGPGVPPTPTTSPNWSSSTPNGRTTTRRRRRRGWVGALVTIVLVVAVLAFLLTRVSDPLQTRARSVTAATVPGTCDTVVDVVGTITTNGRPGPISFQWIRNDDQPTSVQTQDATEGATSTRVHLRWSFRGRGRFDARATLRVLDPAPTSEAVGTFTYSCP